MRSAADVVAASLAAWDSPLEDALFGTRDPRRIVELVDAYCLEHLGRRLRELAFYRRGVGAVFGLRLADGSGAALKVHRPDLVGDRLDAIVRLQRHVRDVGVPAPRPLAGPAPLGDGVATAEELLEDGAIADAHDPWIRRSLAEALHGFVAAATPLGERLGLADAMPFDTRDDRLWPTPHDLRFNFSLPDAGWIDRAAKTAREALASSVGDRVVGHGDFRVENVRMEGERVVAIFDWDSVGVWLEPALVGHSSAGFTADWSDPDCKPWPSPEESRAFVLDYEIARGRPFTRAERATADAAYLYSVAYGSRCEHSDVALGVLPHPGPERGWRSLLRARLRAPLFDGP